MKIEVRKVTNRREMDDFIRLPHMLHAGVSQYVPDLDRDVRAMFDRHRNSGLEFSIVQPFVAYVSGADGKVSPAGRIVGIINKKANAKWQQQVVRFGMIEFIDDAEVSRVLLDTVAHWGKEHGMDTIQGPMGVTDFDKEGMLVDDFHLPGTLNTIWNPSYYPTHMEQHGFEKEVDWLQIRIRIPHDVPPRYSRVAQYAREQIGLRVIKLTNSDIKRGYGRKIFDLFNAAYAPIFGFSELSSSQIDEFLNTYVKLVDKQLIPIVMNDKDEMVGAAITMASLTHAMQKTGGRLWPFGWWHLLKSLRLKHENHVEMLLVAVRPDYQGLGVNALFFDDLIPIYNKYGFEWAETGPQLENNVRELSQWKPLQPEYVKRRRCYKKTIV